MSIYLIITHTMRAGNPFETQVLMKYEDLGAAYTNKMSVLDFTMAFDNGPHEWFIVKLDHYGIWDNTLAWKWSFLA